VVGPSFFACVGDAIGGIVRLIGGDPHVFTHSYGVKVWFGDSVREHYEAQLIRPDRALRLEIGFHSEHPNADHNDSALAVLTSTAATWRPALGSEPAAGPFLGRRGWTRLSECWDPPAEGLDGAIEVAVRLADYMTQLEPIRIGNVRQP
jgi:hypothetical protein